MTNFECDQTLINGTVQALNNGRFECGQAGADQTLMFGTVQALNNDSPPVNVIELAQLGHWTVICLTNLRILLKRAS